MSQKLCDTKSFNKNKPSGISIYRTRYDNSELEAYSIITQIHLATSDVAPI